MMTRPIGAAIVAAGLGCMFRAWLTVSLLAGSDSGGAFFKGNSALNTAQSQQPWTWAGCGIVLVTIGAGVFFYRGRVTQVTKEPA